LRSRDRRGGRLACLQWATRSLPCNFEPARALFGQGTACPAPVALVGHDTFVPAVICGALVIASVLVFLRSFTGMAVASSRAKRDCSRQRVPFPSPVAAMSAWSQRPPKWLVVVPEGDPVAYCLGLLRPRVVVSSGLLERLDCPSLKAVLEHEASHRRRRDPLRQAILGSIVATMALSHKVA
jgi:Zn-dependent protease with chaperone function